MGEELLYAATRAVMAEFPGMAVYNEIPMQGAGTPYAFVSVEGFTQRQEGFRGGSAYARTYTVAARVFPGKERGRALALETGERLMRALRVIDWGGISRASAISCDTPSEGGALVRVAAEYPVAVRWVPEEKDEAEMMRNMLLNKSE